MSHKKIQDETQNFQKFAAQLVSPSEVFEPRSARQRISIPESLELLGSLASLTRSSLVQQASGQSSDLASTSSAMNPLAASRSSPSSTLGTKIPGVQYETSHKEYRQALEDQRIAEALCRLQAHRTSAASKAGQRAGAIIRNSAAMGATSGQPNAHANAQVNDPAWVENEYRFQYASFPQVNASVKPSPMKRSPGTYQPILRPSRPEQK